MLRISKPILIHNMPHVNIPFHIGYASGKILSLTETHIFIEFNNPVLMGWFTYHHPVSEKVLEHINPIYFNLLENGPRP